RDNGERAGHPGAGPQEGVRRDRRGRGRRPRRPARRDLLAPRTERRRQDHHRRDPGRLPPARRRRGRGARGGPRRREHGLARRDFWKLIKGLAGAGTTILLTTHYLDEAEALADRVGVIAEGRLLEVSPPATLAGRDKQPAVVRWREGGVAERAATNEPTRFV